MTICIVPPKKNDLPYHCYFFSNTVAAYPDTAFILFHGAGLDSAAPLYLSLGNKLSSLFDVYVPNIHASGFINYNNGFRKPSGWAFHRTQQAIDDSLFFLDWVARKNYKRIIIGGHSWGGLLSLACSIAIKKCFPVILLSPLTSMRNIVHTNYGHDLDRITQIAHKNHNSLAITNTINNAPFPFLSNTTLLDIISCEWDLGSFFSSWSEPILTTIGELEHDALKYNIKDSFSDISPSLYTLHFVQKQGHFYTSGSTLLLNIISSWVSDSLS